MANPKQATQDAFPQVILCADAAETRRAAATLGEILRQPGKRVISLDGPLGVGKTEFVKGLAEALGCGGPVTSPTFSIAHEYPGREGALYHFDFYRLGNPDELETCGFFECVGQGTVVVEWGEKFRDFLPAGTLWIRMEILSDGMTRRIERAGS